MIGSIGDSSHPYHGQHVHVIQSLADVKSVLLLADMPGANPLISRLFNDSFDALSITGGNLSKHVEFNLTAVLECMLEECGALPGEAVESILAQFLYADPATTGSSAKSKKCDNVTKIEEGQVKLQTQLPPSYTAAKNLCNTCVDRMARYVSQYFGNVVVDASSLHTRNVDDEHGNVSDEDMNQLEKAHRLLRELWRSCPGVLQNVIPQIEAEMSTENVQIRALATEAIGDMVAGIGAGGEVTAPPLNPSAYPLPSSINEVVERSANTIPQSFSQSHPSTYQVFLGRRNDKSSTIRAKWAISAGRILSTSAGGTGLEQHSEQELISRLSQMAVDSDDKVRMAAIQAVELLSVKQMVLKLGPQGGMDVTNSFLYHLAERVKDKKPAIRQAAIRFLARAWAAALGAIVSGEEEVKKLLGAAPSKIFNAYFLNDRETNCFIDSALFDYLCPMNYPTLKRPKPNTNGVPQAAEGNTYEADLDPDRIRTERILFLINDLDVRAKQVFFALISRPSKTSPYMNALLKDCESFNGGITEGNEKAVTQHLNKLIEYFAKSSLDPGRAADDLWRFAKLHDRRSYALVRFCMAVDSDYRKIQKSLRELERKLAGLPSPSTGIFETLRPLVYKVSNLFSNKSHIRPIIEFTQKNHLGLASAAQDLLKHISTETPSIFKSHSVALCRSLEDSAPTESQPNDGNMLDSLKACASFAKKFPTEVPKERKFFQAITQYALDGVPPATAKHAVSIIMHSADSRQMYAKDLVKACTENFQYGDNRFLTKLACLSQLMHLAAEELEDESDTVIDVAINQVLKHNRNTDEPADQPDWSDELDDEIQAKIWALRILVNRIRHYADPEAVKDVAPQVYQMLTLLIKNRGEFSRTAKTLKSHCSRLFLQAAFSLLKLSSKRGFDTLLDHASFNTLVLTAQDPVPQVRAAFVNKVKKLLGHDRLPTRFYVCTFITAFEPQPRLLDDTATWLRARAATQRQLQERAQDVDRKDAAARPVLETALARFLATLAHHPDFSTNVHDLCDFAKYITFYLSCVATESTLSLIYHVAQRVKSVQDGLADTWDSDEASSSNLYVLSDLAQAVIREWMEQKRWTLQVQAGKVALPAGVFKPLPSADAARSIATRNFLPDGVTDKLEDVVHASMSSKAHKKRKADTAEDGDQRARKRAAAAAKVAKQLPIRNHAKRPRTPPDAEGAEEESDEDDWASSSRRKKRARSDDVPSSERRKSARSAAGSRKSYADMDDSDEERELLQWQEGFGAVSATTTEAEAAAAAENGTEATAKATNATGAEAEADAAAAALDGLRDEEAADGSSKENEVAPPTKPKKGRTSTTTRAPRPATKKEKKDVRVGTRTSARRAKG